MDCIVSGAKPEDVPNLVWRDSDGTVRENPFSHVPDDLSHVMVNHYAHTVRSVLRYRDLASYMPFRGWMDYPITAVFTCRGCTENCSICGGSAAASRGFLNRQRPVFRSPEAVAEDVRQIARFSRGPAFILGDLNQAGEGYASKLFHLLRSNRVKNQLIFEVFNPAPRDFFYQMSLSAPGFCLEISPESHDPEVRKAEGRHYSNEELEQMIGDALDVGCSRLDVFFMIGVPQQTPQSALDTVEYCDYLMDKFKGDRRLYLFTAPLAPFLDPGSRVFEQPEKHGYRILFRSVEEHRQALVQPSWKYSLNYETDWMTREQIVDTTYEAMLRLNSLKAKHGVISEPIAQAENHRLKAAREMMHRIDDILSRGNHEELPGLKEQIDQINMSPSTHWEELKLPVGPVRIRFLRSLWSWVTGR
jgi:B12-binding domain/radical SAM domain protein